MSDQSLKVSIPEAVCASAAIIRGILNHLVQVGALTPEEFDTLFVLSKKDLSSGRYDPETVEGAQAFLDCLYQSIGIAGDIPAGHSRH